MRSPCFLVDFGPDLDLDPDSGCQAHGSSDGVVDSVSYF